MKHESRVKFESSIINGKLFSSCYTLPKVELTIKNAINTLEILLLKTLFTSPWTEGFFSAYKGRLGPKLEKTKKSKAKHCAAAEVW